jgi:hypothetical protein
MYSCSHNSDTQRKDQKGKDRGKHRDKLKMKSFACNGWLHVIVAEDSDCIRVKLSHDEAHVPFCTVSIPDDVKDFISANAKLSMTAVSSCHFGNLQLADF